MKERKRKKDRGRKIEGERGKERVEKNLKLCNEKSIAREKEEIKQRIRFVQISNAICIDKTTRWQFGDSLLRRLIGCSIVQSMNM